MTKIYNGIFGDGNYFGDASCLTKNTGIQSGCFCRICWIASIDLLNYYSLLCPFSGLLS